MAHVPGKRIDFGQLRYVKEERECRLTHRFRTQTVPIRFNRSREVSMTASLMIARLGQKDSLNALRHMCHRCVSNERERERSEGAHEFVRIDSLPFYDPPHRQYSCIITSHQEARGPAIESDLESIESERSMKAQVEVVSNPTVILSKLDSLDAL